MGETMTDMDIEVEEKDNKIQCLEDKKGIPDSKIVKKKNRLDLNITSSKESNVMGL